MKKEKKETSSVKEGKWEIRSGRRRRYGARGRNVTVSQGSRLESRHLRPGSLLLS